MAKIRSVFIRLFGILAANIVLLSAPAGNAIGYVIDTTASPSALTGVWWNQNESGWGMTITQQYDVIVVAMYTYDSNRNPIWYVSTNCPVVAGGCTSPIYRVTGGSGLTVPWSPNLAVIPVGSISLAFTDNNTGTMNFTINGASSAKAITRYVFRGPTLPTVGLPPVLFTDVFQAWMPTGGGYRYRGIHLTSTSSSMGCGYTDPIPDRATLEQFVNSSGGTISVSTPTAWCGQIGTESNCVMQFGNVVVEDMRNTGTIEIDIYMQSLVANRMTTVSYDSVLRQAVVSSRTNDGTVTSGVNCNNSGQPDLAKEAINGDWIGYSVNYSPTSKVGSLVASSMSCKLQVCTIVGGAGATVTLPYSGSNAWRSATGTARLAGAVISTDQALASAFLCNGATLNPTQTFESCTFFSLKRL